MNWTINTNTLIVSAIWVSQLCYLMSFFPQFILNYRLKSVSGLSDLYIFAFFVGYLSELYYVFCLQLPTPYLFMIPLSTIAMTVLVYQRFYYGVWDSWSKKIAGIYLTFGIIACTLIPVAMSYQHKFGHIAGWLTTSVWSTYQLPQIIRIFTTRTMVGFSFGLAGLLAMAEFIECGMAVLLQLPYQTIITSASGVFVFLIYSLQFMWFRR